MKMRKFRSYLDLKPILIAGSIILSGSLTATYYLTERKTQICSEYSTVHDLDIYINENGEYCKYFPTGEHVIQISRNDVLYHKYSEVDGYMILDAEYCGWRDNSKAKYVNTEPVVAVGKEKKNGKIEFNHFGEVYENSLDFPSELYPKMR